MSRRARPPRERGVILVVVLLVLVAAVALALALGRETRVEIAVARARADDVLLRALADSALERARAALRADDLPGDTLFDAWRDDESAFAGAALGEPGGEGAGRMWFLLVEEDPGDGREVRYGLRDEASRLDVNVADREQLLALPGITEEAVDAILDWRDEDDEITGQGAESAYYLALDPPYRAKNGPIESLDELLRVRGIDPIMLYGEDRNRNGLLDPGEDDGDLSFPPDDADGALDRGLVDYLTVFSRDLDRTLDGRTRLAWSEADPDALAERLTAAGVSEEAVERMREVKEEAEQASSLGEIVGRLLATSDGQLDVAEVGLILDEITVGSGQGEAVPGRINVNTASRPVLAGLFEPGEVEAVLTRRLDPAADLSTPAWLLEVLEPARFAAVIDRVTTRSWQFTLDAVVLLDARPRFRRFEALLDRSFAPVRVLTWRDTTGRGFPLPGERGESLP